MGEDQEKNVTEEKREEDKQDNENISGRILDPGEKDDVDKGDGDSEEVIDNKDSKVGEGEKEEKVENSDKKNSQSTEPTEVDESSSEQKDVAVSSAEDKEQKDLVDNIPDEKKETKNNLVESDKEEEGASEREKIAAEEA